MRTKKILSQSPPITSRLELDEVTGEIAAAIVERAALTEELNGKIVELRQKYEARLDALNGSIEAQTDDVLEYVSAHDDVIPANRKSVELLHAVIGFRTGMPKVKPLKGWTLKGVLEACIARKPSWVRKVEELDKDRIIADVQPGGVVESVGVSVVQDETFFVEPKLDAPAEAATKR